MSDDRERTYREQGKPIERRFLACPTCSRAVEVDGDADLATCTTCEHGFPTATALTVEADNARRALVKYLEPLPPERGLTAKERFAISGFVVGGILVATLVFGATGAAVGLLSVGVLWIVSMTLSGGDPYR